MNKDNNNLEWKLCEAYFTILEKNVTPQVNLDQLSIATKISREEIDKIVLFASHKFSESPHAKGKLIFRDLKILLN